MIVLMGLTLTIEARSASAVENKSVKGMALYSQLKGFVLDGGSARVENLKLTRDRAEMTFTGTFYFSSPVEGLVTSAVFIGDGTFRAVPPNNEFEIAHLRRILDSDTVESDFKSAVLRFYDETFEVIGKNAVEGSGTSDAEKLAAAHSEHVLRDSGANAAARIALAILNKEPRGFFMAEFDGGKRDRFSYLFDPQTRIPTANFDINGGESTLVYSYSNDLFDNEVWLASHSMSDYEKGIASYSDLNDLVDITHYDATLDLTNPSKRLGLLTKVRLKSRVDNLHAIPFKVGENLGVYDDQRKDKQMRVKAASLNEKPLDFAQEEWEGGFTVFLAEPLKAGEEIEISLEMEGDFVREPGNLPNCHYPRSNTSWYPRHGYLDRSTYDLTFKHAKKNRIAAVGRRVSEGPSSEDKDVYVTKYEMRYPISLATFALGPFERHNEEIKWDNGDPATELEFNSLPGAYVQLKESFVLAELNNSVRYFHALFGRYPYDTFSATFHPFGFGQGFPSMLMIPATDRASKYTYAFVSHETAHQWWGNIVAWRSYRDQWLSEGFAEYSGVLYTNLRANPKAASSLIDQMRSEIKDPPRTTLGIGKGKLAEVGPLILGHRLRSKKTLNAYGALIYAKGGLTLRMLHFLFSEPGNGDDKAFFDMMKDFVNTNRNGIASTDDFRAIANKHFVNTQIAKKYNLQDLDWFFAQWVYGTDLPSYKLEYEIIDNSDKSVTVKGSVIQENTGEKFFMPLPLVFDFGNKQVARGTVHAFGPNTPFSINLPVRPKKVELDPDKWILSEKTSEKQIK